LREPGQTTKKNSTLDMAPTGRETLGLRAKGIGPRGGGRRGGHRGPLQEK